MNASWPSPRCTGPLMLPVPKARRVTLTSESPRVTQSVADFLAAASLKGLEREASSAGEGTSGQCRF